MRIEVACGLVRKWRKWGPIAEDDSLAGRKCEKGPRHLDKVRSEPDAATTCAFLSCDPSRTPMLRFSPNTDIRTCNQTPLGFLTPGAQKQRNRNARNQRQSSQRRASDAQMPLKGGAAMYARRAKQASRGGDVKNVGIANRHQVTVRDCRCLLCMSHFAQSNAPYGGRIEFIPP